MKTLLAGVCALIFSQFAFASDIRWKRVLLQDEWPGGPELEALMKKDHSDVCRFLDQAALTYSGTEYVERRILMTLTASNCPNRLVAAKKFIGSEQPLIREAAVKLAASLPLEQRKDIRPQIQVAIETEKDFAVRAAISEFLERPSRRTIASPSRGK